MKVNRDNFWEFDWLVRTSPGNLLLLMIFIPILFFIWLFKVGQLSERKLSLKPDYLFRFLLVIFSLGITLSFSTLVFGEFLDFDKYFNYIFWPIYLCFIYVDFYITKLTCKVENKKKHSSGFAEKVGRFIVLSTLILGAFLLQPTFNKLFDKD
ncbi:hypothetical protein [Aquipluma nitroreducens]|uniref:hypothetical protein n=1 Tax=Aquipluma nitroreducens TaxID=2010828 RepID=UPI00296E8D42|nr:hypothetical protein [Aquipluma nitroreducens]